jgi:hypothetical protein
MSVPVVGGIKAGKGEAERKGWCLRGKEKEGGGRAGWSEIEEWRDRDRRLGRERVVEGGRAVGRES